VYIAADPLLTRTTLFDTTPASGELLRRQIPYGSPFFARGRVALWSAFKSMAIATGSDVLLPAFICDSVVGPIEAVGARPRFFRTGPAAEIDVTSIRMALTSVTSAVIVPHYFGFPTPLDEIKALCDEHGLWLIEDCAHALYSFVGASPVGRLGHAAMFSPWKSLPLPDGGVLAFNDSRLVRPEPLPDMDSLHLAARMIYRVLPTLETAVGWSPRLRLLRRRGLRESIQDRDRSPEFRRESGSSFSYQVLERTDGQIVRARRRANFERLAKSVASQPYLRALFTTLDEGVCPLGFPVLSTCRDDARSHFLQLGINVRAYWERLPREVTQEAFPDAHKLSKEILILPVHQSLTQRQLDHLVSAIERFSAGSPK
jgi:dTDP-4-amino-4,6-dideoxygalactose transaminase